MPKSITKKTHLGAYGIIKKDDAILLIKKIRGPYVGLLDLPGGKIEHRESPEETLVREVLEETGVVVKTSCLKNVFTNNVMFENEDEFIDMHHVGIIYEVTQFGDENLIKDLSEEDSGGTEWFFINGDKNRLSPFAKQIL